MSRDSSSSDRNPLPHAESQEAEGASEFQPLPRTWARKFGDAFRGIAAGVRGQRSFDVHLVSAILVVIAGFVLRVSWEEWCLLILCIGQVMVAELFNSALEWLARAIDTQYNARIEHGLNVASGAVFIASVSSAIVGTLIFGRRLWILFLAP